MDSGFGQFHVENAMKFALIRSLISLFVARGGGAGLLLRVSFLSFGRVENVSGIRFSKKLCSGLFANLRYLYKDLYFERKF